MNSIEELFIEGICSIAKNLPSQVRLKAKQSMLDYLGVLAGGKKYLEMKHPELVEVLVNKSDLEIAMLNGFAAHVLELDDGHRHGMIHLGASIVSAVLAVAEKEKLSSDCILRGITMGYEVAVRCARAIQPGHKKRGYHVSGTCGTIGSAMGIAFACGFSKEQLKSTLACAVSSAAGFLEIQEQASELKPYNLGRAAYDGVLAAQIGKLAISGPDDILGGKRGFLAVFTDTPRSEFLTEFKDEFYCIEGIYQKVHAACRHCHPAIDATIYLRNHQKFSLEQIDKIMVHTYKLAISSHDHIQIQGISSAKLSTPYAVALALVKGSAGFTDYNEDNLSDYWVKELTRKVSVIEDENLTEQSPAVRGAKVTVVLNNGGVFNASCLYPKGEPENPLTQNELEEKFRALSMYGGLTAKDCDEVISEIWKKDFSISKVLKIICKK